MSDTRSPPLRVRYKRLRLSSVMQNGGREGCEVEWFSNSKVPGAPGFHPNYLLFLEAARHSLLCDGTRSVQETYYLLRILIRTDEITENTTSPLRYSLVYFISLLFFFQGKYIWRIIVLVGSWFRLAYLREKCEWVFFVLLWVYAEQGRCKTKGRKYKKQSQLDLEEWNKTLRKKSHLILEYVFYFFV